MVGRFAMTFTPAVALPHPRHSRTTTLSQVAVPGVRSGTPNASGASGRPGRPRSRTGRCRRRSSED
eukprot:1551661-Heterocapsa_arctica.AAC.2